MGSDLSSVSALVCFHTPTLGAYVGVLVLLILLGLSAFVSGAEAAFFSLPPADRDSMKAQQEREGRYALALRMLDNQDRLLAAILITNNLVNVGVVILANFVTDSLVTFAESSAWGFLVKMVLITFLLLLFGEIMPKMLAANRPLAYVRMAEGPLYAVYCFWGPISALLSRSVSRVHQRIAPKVQLSMDQLGKALEITHGQLAEEEGILKRLVQYGHLEASEIMTPRLDVVAVERGVDYDALRQRVLESGYSRIPVYDETLDRVVGVLYVKDLLPHIDEPTAFDWFRLVRKPYFAPENKKINDLFAEFQRLHIHLAIVVDEYGGTCGLVTLEDVLEEIFGEIGDESDAEKPLYTRLGERVYQFAAKIQLNDFCKVLEIDDSLLDDLRGEAETVGGLVLEQLGRFPERGEVLKLKHMTFTVEAVSARRIELIKVEF